jgi:UDP-N-acetylmuramate--alanine ligase
MRSLAQTLLDWGWRLTGSDPACESLPPGLAAAVRVFREPNAANLPPDAELVVFSDAVAPDHVERQRASELGIPAISYFECLGRMMQGKRGLAVAGTHGKSTVTAMTAEILTCAGLDPTVVFGAAPLGRETGGRVGAGPALLVEACEYRAHFLHLTPQHAILLDIEPDHFDFFRQPSQLEQAFADFVALLPPDGLLLAATGCPSVCQASRQAKCRCESFGLSGHVDWTANPTAERNGCFEFELLHEGQSLGRARLRVPGRHNMLNAVAAAALAWHQGVAPGALMEGLQSFRGLARRLETLGTWGGITLVDDYAHHPTEVSAGIEAIRKAYPERRLWCVFQPHQASRTACLLDEFAASLQNAHKVAVADIFRAREPPIQKGEATAFDLAEKTRSLGADVADVHTPAAIVDLLVDALQPGDILMTMGAGDIRKISDGFIHRIRKNRAAR